MPQQREKYAEAKPMEQSLSGATICMWVPECRHHSILAVVGRGGCHGPPLPFGLLLLLGWSYYLSFLSLRVCRWSWRCFLRIFDSRQLYFFDPRSGENLFQLLENLPTIRLRQVHIRFPGSFDIQRKFIARAILEQMEVLQIGLTVRLSIHLLEFCEFVGAKLGVRGFRSVGIFWVGG